MNLSDFTVSITVDTTAQVAFDAVNNVHGWWTEHAEGNSEKSGDEFSVRFGDVHFSKQKLTEVIPGQKVVWLITDSRLNFIEDKTEWTNTKISFEITGSGKQTQIKFTHVGLLPGIECYGPCSNAWTYYIKESLFKLLTEGKGTPELK